MKPRNLNSIILFCLALFLKGDAIQKTNFLERKLADFPASNSTLVYSDEKINAYYNSDQFESVESQKKRIIKTAKKSQFFLFGDFHIGDIDNKFLISLLPDLKKAGYENIALEIDYSDQREIDNYVYLHKNREKLQANILYDVSPYIDIIDSASNLGFSIWCFDTRPLFEGENIRKQGEFSSFGADRNKKMYDRLIEYFYTDKKITIQEETISISTKKKNTLFRPKTKFIIFTGATHCNEKSAIHPATSKIEATLGYYLTQNGFRTYSLSLADYPPYVSSIDEIFPVYYIQEK